MASYPLIWQFQSDGSQPADAESLSDKIKNIKQWEARFFWREDESIILSHLDEDALYLKNYKHESKIDTYVLDEHNRNIKLREDKLHFKPLLTKEDSLTCYEKKQKFIPLKDYMEIRTLLPKLPKTQPHSINEFNEWLLEHYQLINVEKESYLYKIKKDSKTRFELSKLIINDALYYSLVVESRLKEHTLTIKKALNINATAVDYIQFLKSLL